MADLTISPGDIPTAAQWNTYFTHTGGAWNSWTPVATQGVTLVANVTEALYYRSGRFIAWSFLIQFTTSGTAGQNISVTLPVATANNAFIPLGQGVFFDSSAGIDYTFMARQFTSTAFTCKAHSGTGNLGSFAFTAAVASGDTIGAAGTYMAASG